MTWDGRRAGHGPWVSLTLTAGLSGGAAYRVLAHGMVELAFSIIGTFGTADAAYTSAAIPAGLRPSGVYNSSIIPISAYVDPWGARPQGVVYLSASSGVLRGASPQAAFTRIRGGLVFAPA